MLAAAAVTGNHIMLLLKGSCIWHAFSMNSFGLQDCVAGLIKFCKWFSFKIFDGWLCTIISLAVRGKLIGTYSGKSTDIFFDELLIILLSDKSMKLCLDNGMPQCW